MNFGDYLKNKQPLIYNTFINALKNNKLSHAYLIKGNADAPLLECAKFLAKSLICLNGNPLACCECFNCLRFDDNNYADFMLLDGSKQNIKVSDIETLQNFFQNTSSEKSEKMIYIIHLLENSNRESLNAILKFLEEPQDNVYAFITTANEEKLLPTILSRTQHLKLIPLDHNDLINSAKEKGVSEDDAELLSQFNGNVDTLVQVATSESYIKIKDLVFDILDCIYKSRGEMLYYIETVVIPFLKDKVSTRLFLDILSIAFKDLINDSLGLDLILSSQKELIHSLNGKINNINECYLQIMFARGQLDLNVNIGLFIDHIGITIYKGVEEKWI